MASPCTERERCLDQVRREANVIGLIVGLFGLGWIIKDARRR